MVTFLLLACVQTGKDVPTETGEPAEVLSTALGVGSGALDPGAAGWTYILGDSEGLDDPRDVGFDPTGNLWIANRKDDHTFIVLNPGADAQTYEDRHDG